ncbi:MAG: GGDEF domain-containing protein [Gammaproteobacteria bacterium]
MNSSTSTAVSPLGKLLARARLALVLLIVVTAVLVTWQRYGMERIIEVDSRNAAVFVDDDRSAGGATVATLERSTGVLKMNCDVSDKFSWPYCLMGFNLDYPGYDLSEFSHITVKVAYEGAGPAQLRLRLVNWEDGFTRQTDWKTFLNNEVTGLDIVPGRPVHIPIKWMSVAQWWRDQAKPPLEHSYTRLDKVVRVDVVTPVELKPGKHRYTVETIQIHGKWISEKNLLIGLIGLWVVCSFAWPIMAALALRNELKQSKNKLELLNEINKALQLETMELAGQAYTDALTGALNRQGLRDVLMRTHALLAQPMSVIFADVDYFKKINDNHGHPTGDEVLKLFAQRLKAEIRVSDRLVRWGGEEFLIVCEGTDAMQATALAEKLRDSLKRHPWPQDIPLTCSFGVAQRRPREEIGAAIQRADVKLYQAKAAGRDRVEVDA